MGYYVRVLTLSPKKVPLAMLRKALDRPELATNAVLNSDSDDWTNITLEGGDDHTIAAIEFNPVVTGELGEEEIDEFLESIAQHRPKSAVKWLESVLPKIKAIYAFQVLSGAHALKGGWESIRLLMECISEEGLGIMQRDGEGFSNLEGSHILWQFSEDASGQRRMAVLRNGTWTSFIMELGNAAQREAFLNGEVPEAGC